MTTKFNCVITYCFLSEMKVGDEFLYVGYDDYYFSKVTRIENDKLFSIYSYCDPSMNDSPHEFVFDLNDDYKYSKFHVLYREPEGK